MPNKVRAKIEILKKPDNENILVFSPPHQNTLFFAVSTPRNDRSAMCSALKFQNVPNQAGYLYYGMSKQQYRSEMGIMGDILNVTMEGGRQGTIVSAISRRANLSHYAVIEKCEKLSNAGLVQTLRTDKNRLYTITEKGIEFVQEFRKFQSLLDALNLRY